MVLTISSNRKLSKIESKVPLLKFVQCDRKLLILKSAKEAAYLVENGSTGISLQQSFKGCV